MKAARAPRAPAVRRLNWGCGNVGEPGWINADRKDGPGVQLSCDIRNGLPVEDDTFDYCVSIHALQELAYPELVPALAELRRVLKPGGILRLGLPDMDRAIHAYLERDRDYFVVPDDDADRIGSKLIVQLMWYGWTRTPFNRDLAEELLRKAGFRDSLPCGFRESRSDLPGITELDNRAGETLFVEARK